jgi:hypothetical protein
VTVSRLGDGEDLQVLGGGAAIGVSLGGGPASAAQRAAQAVQRALFAKVTGRAAPAPVVIIGPPINWGGAGGGDSAGEGGGSGEGDSGDGGDGAG